MPQDVSGQPGGRNRQEEKVAADGDEHDAGQDEPGDLEIQDIDEGRTGKTDGGAGQEQAGKGR